MDLKTNIRRNKLPEYQPYSKFNFELQIRTIVQDSWSVLDHKIKYKKSIPNELKRRINVLSALFELADREFREIRDLTQEEIENAESETENKTDSKKLGDAENGNILNAFSFLKIGGHFYPKYEFQPHKVDGFVHNIHEFSPGITRAKFHNLINKNISKVKSYLDTIEAITTNPFVIFRHCLYLGEKDTFERLLTNTERKYFNDWLNKA